jgi:Icc-related predicted phosphoesterase
MKKSILFSDLHCNNKQLQNLYDFIIKNNDIDALIFAGDVVNMGEPVWFMEKFIKIIDELKRPFLWVPGNNDFGRAYHKLNARYKSLEGKVVKYCGQKFSGVGGSPTSWAGQYEGESMIDKKAIGGSIFISHYPPPGRHFLSKYDQPCHSERSEESIRNALIDPSAASQDDNQRDNRQFADAPLVHVCGHLHYRWGTAFMGQTKIIQLASLETGHYAILDLETLAVKFERF